MGRRSLRVGVFIEQTFGGGGGFQHVLTQVKTLCTFENSAYDFVFFTNVEKNIAYFRNHNVKIILCPYSKIHKFFGTLKRSYVFGRLLSLISSSMSSTFLDKFMKKHGVDLVYFTSPTHLAYDLHTTNFVYTLWDLCHRDQVEFPEVRGDEFLGRERVYRDVLPRATAVITESKYGKKAVVQRYGVDSKRVHIVPLVPSEQIMSFFNNEITYSTFDIVRKKYGIDKEYIFYPAQMWPHKNHIYILEALRILKKQYDKHVMVIFSGSDAGNLDHILAVAHELEIEELINYIGFADEKEIPLLYLNSLALVMPTYFGPTNIPPLEAMALGVPVLYSDIPGAREQLGDFAVFLDLKDPSSLSSSLLEIINNPDVLREKIKVGQKKLLEKCLEDYVTKTIEVILDEFVYKKRCWK